MWDACLCKARTHLTYEHDQKHQKIEAHTHTTHTHTRTWCTSLCAPAMRRRSTLRTVVKRRMKMRRTLRRTRDVCAWRCSKPARWCMYFVCVCTSRASRCMQYVCIIVCVCKCACVCLCTWRCACEQEASSLVCSARWRSMVRPLSQINSAILVVSRAHKQAVFQQVGVRSLSAACSALYSSSCECRWRSALAQQSVTL